SSSVKAAELKKAGSGYELASLGLEALGPDTVVDGAIMDSNAVSFAVNSIVEGNKIKTKHVATAVAGHSVIVKRVAIPASNEAELASSISLEAQQHIPFEIEDVNLSYQIMGVGPTGNDMDVMLVAVKREKISNHTRVLTQSGMVPRVVDIDAFALQNAFEANYEPPPESTIALLNIGASLMNINIIQNGVPLFTRDVSVGGNQYTDMLQKELDLTFDDAEALKQGKELEGVSLETVKSHIESVSEILLLEVRKTFDFFRATTSAEQIQQIYVAGGTARVEGMLESLRAEFDTPVEELNPFQQIGYNPSKFDPTYISEVAPRMAIAVGLALRSFDAP
ncbi:MAG: type IV pilus assembly protein PilM, partial [Acidobacteriota bacterium]